MVAALFVRRVNHYAPLGVDCYDEDRDALTWQGGCPGIFHPPCRGWGNFKGMSKHKPEELDLARWSLSMVRRHGGVVEHPLGSGLWKEAGVRSWGVRDTHGGILVPILQSWFGHRAPKATGLYIVGGPEMPVIPSEVDDDPGHRVEWMGRAERERTTPDLAAWLVQIASQCRVAA